MNELLTPSYWFTLSPPNMDGMTGIVVGAVFIALFLAGVALKMLSNRKGKHVQMERVGRMLSTMGFLGIVLAFLSYENIRLLGARFWYLVWILGLLIWIGCIVWKMKKEKPAAHDRDVARETIEKYLPKPKK